MPAGIGRDRGRVWHQRSLAQFTEETVLSSVPRLVVPDGTELTTVSVVIPAYTMDRWESLCEAVDSVQAQAYPYLETIVVVDHSPGLLERAERELKAAKVIPSAGTPGVSGARNTGVSASRGELVAFLDEDAVASPEWLSTLIENFVETTIVGAACYIKPLWAKRRPWWLPPEFNWAVGISYRGMPHSPTAVRNVWTCSMVMRRYAFEAVGGFRDGLGKVGNRPWPEDTDLCLRVAAMSGKAVWLYDPRGVVHHRVPVSRTTLIFFLRRCFDEGWGKAHLAKLDGAGESTSLERKYVQSILPGGLARALGEAVRGNLAGLFRGGAIVAGLSAAAAGYLGYQFVSIRACYNADRHTLPGTADSQPKGPVAVMRTSIAAQGQSVISDGGRRAQQTVQRDWCSG